MITKSLSNSFTQILDVNSCPKKIIIINKIDED